MKHALVPMLALLLASCGSGDAKKSADIVSGDARGAAADNPICRLFTPAELEAYVGEPVGQGGNAAMGSGCQWSAKDGDGDVIVAAVPADYSEVPSLAPGFRKVPELGEDGYVAADLGGWVAGAVRGKDYVKVTVAGAKASPETAIALFKETAKRRPAA